MTDLLSGAEPEITTADKIAELKAEIAMRERVYGRFVAEKKMSEGAKDRKIAIMQAIVDDYEQGRMG